MKNTIITIATFFTLVLTLCATTDAAAQRIRAKQLAQDASETLMRNVCPMTGYNATYIVHDAEESNSGKLEVEMTAMWRGKTWAFSDEFIFEVRGFLTVDANGRSTFRQTYKNRAVLAAESNGKWAIGTVVALGVLAASSDN